MQKIKFNLEELKEVVASVMYEDFSHDGPRYMTPSQISNRTNKKIPTNVVSLILEDLSNPSKSTTFRIWEKTDPMDPLGTAESTYYLSPEAINFIMHRDDEAYSKIIAEYCSNKNSPRQENKIIAPASDRVVTLDHNSKDYKDAVEAVDDVIDAIHGDNEYVWAAPEEKEAVLGALQAGRKLLDGLKVKYSTVQATLLTALHYVSDNVAKGTLAALGAAAVAAVAKLFGLL